MTQNSLLPPPKKGGKMIIALVAVAGLGGVYLAMQPETEELAPVEEAESAPNAAPATSLAQHSFMVEEPPPSEPDAAVEEEPEETEAAPRARRGGGSAGCEGTLSASAARQVVNRNRGRVRSCYERRLKTINSLQGQVSVTLRIGTSGQVSGVRVGGSLRDPEVFSCIRSAVSSWTFPAPEGGCANLSVPFSFSPRM